MPFAPFDLTDNVVRGNWNHLHQISIIGNPLGFVMGNTLEKKGMKGRAPCVQAAHHLVTEETLWEGDFETWLTKAPTMPSSHTDGEEPSGDEENTRRMHALNATLTTFKQPLTDDWPSGPPTRIKNQYRSKL